MKPIQIATDIIPLAEFKVHLSSFINKVKSTGQTLIITQNGKPAGVLISPAEYDKLVYQKLLTESINRGLSDGENGNTLTTEELKAELKQRRD